METSGYGRDGIYRSIRPPLALPSDPNLSLVSFLFRNLNSYTNKLALIDADSGEILTFNEFESMVSKVSHGFLQLGIKKGDVVLIVSPNSVQFPICFLGIVSIGAIATTANLLYTTNELSKQVKDSSTKLIITIPELWEKVKDFNLPALILGAGDSSGIVSSSRVTSFSELVNMAGPVSGFPKVCIKQTDTAALLYSSGTTGTSKGVILTHQNFIATGLMSTCDQDLNEELHNVCLCFLPMFHIFGLSMILYGQLRRGNAVVSMGRYDLEMVMRCVEKYRVTHVFGVPPVMIALAKQTVATKYDLSSLKQLLCGAAPLRKEIMEGCSKKLPQAVVVQVLHLKQPPQVLFISEENFIC